MGKSTPVMGLDDGPMWDSMQRGQLELMVTRETGRFRYPPAPICPETLSMQADWKPVSGKGVIVSWVIFHKQYFEDFPPPYNCVAVRLAEGPIIVTNLVGPEPEGSWIGRAVELDYVQHGDRTQHAARLATKDA